MKVVSLSDDLMVLELSNGVKYSVKDDGNGSLGVEYYGGRSQPNRGTIAATVAGPQRRIAGKHVTLSGWT